MATAAVIEGRPHQFEQDQFLASGGEADVYRFRPDPSFTQRFGNGPFVVKLFREEGNDAKRRAVEERQDKLRAFPQELPDDVIKPLSLACDPSQRVNGTPKVIGYAMPFVTGGTPLIQFKAPKFRKDNPERVTFTRLCRILVNLHALVSKVHQCDVVIGDLNDKNVLVGPNDEVYLLDADSLQYGEWECPAFVPNFVDPKIIQVHHKDASRIKKVGHHSAETDWYAFTVIAFQLLVRINPYLDGFCRLKKGGKPVKGNRRIQHRISVFHPEVTTPKTALPLDLLPESIHEVFRMVFVDEARGEFPLEVLTETEWAQCISCGIDHGRSTCPRCSAAPSPATPITTPGPTTRPARPATRTPIQLPGQILATATQDGKLRCVYYHDGAYRREDREAFWTTVFTPEISVFPAGNRTVITRGNRFAIFDGGPAPVAHGTQQVYGKTTVAANSKHVYWVDGSSLVRDDAHRGTVTMGSVAANLTSVWAGERFGLALVQAGTLTRVLTFNTTRPVLARHDLPVLPGTVVDAHCVISDHLAWLVLSIRLTSGRVRNRCYVFDSRAQLHASAEANRGGKTWLGHVSGSAHAAGTKLFIPVPGSGIVRVGFENRAIEQGKIVRGSIALVPDRSTVGIHTTPDSVQHIGPNTITPIS